MRRYLNRVQKKNQRGFSLLEILAVVIIIGTLTSIVGVAVMGRLGEANIKTTQIQITRLGTALDTFKMDNGFYPSTEQGIEALIEEPTIGRNAKNYSSDGYLQPRKLPKDPWNNYYNYREPGIKNQSSYDLWSNGPDGQEGTEDDITNWDLEG